MPYRIPGEKKQTLLRIEGDLNKAVRSAKEAPPAEAARLLAAAIDLGRKTRSAVRAGEFDLNGSDRTRIMGELDRYVKATERKLHAVEAKATPSSQPATQGHSKAAETPAWLRQRWAWSAGTLRTMDTEDAPTPRHRSRPAYHLRLQA
jgi:hypothetical protein